MIDIRRWLEINNMDDAGERSQKILSEVQPKLRQIIDEFIDTYKTNAQELSHYLVHGYESTLKTTVADAKNPKYKDKKANYGRKGFVELQEVRYFHEPYYESIYTALRLNVKLNSKQLRIEMTPDFYPFKIGVQKSNEKKLLDMLNQLKKISRFG